MRDRIGGPGSVRGHDVGILGELDGGGEIIAEEFVELLDAHRLRLDAELCQALCNGRRLQCALGGIVNPVEDVARCVRRRR